MSALAADANEEFWVFLRDKPNKEGGRIEWDVRQQQNGASLDLPVDPHYLALIEAAGIKIRVASRWFNAISVEVGIEQQRWLETQPFVVKIEKVRKGYPPPKPPSIPLEAAGKTLQSDEYGPSFEQVSQLNVIALHDQGFKGRGIRIAVLDNGFQYTTHKAFAQLNVVAERDFVNGDDVVSNQTNQPVTGDETRSAQNVHGAQVLSILAAQEPGRMIGVAPEAEYLLAKTENNSSEEPIEEDFWVAGLEWADSLGADIVNSSLGYNIWDDGSGYSYNDLDGATALTSRAATLAVQQGMILVVAAGNEGNSAWTYITAPADAPGVITVGAVDFRREIAASSSRGPTADGRIKPDLVAPGVQVVVADVRRGDFLRSNGTSFATPLVSGVCALLLEMHPDWDPEQMLRTLRQTATDLGEAGPDTLYGWGLVDALKASGLAVRQLDGLVAAPFPNPASQELMYFPLKLASGDKVELRIFDLSGNLVRKLGLEHYGVLEQALRWDLGNEDGRRLGNGVYFYQLRTSGLQRRGKIALIP
jgi:subtilisin family serine protease